MGCWMMAEDRIGIVPDVNDALIREFIANIVTEKKRHIKNVILIVLGCLAIVLVRYMFKLV